jgi:hypothetical protein
VNIKGAYLRKIITTPQVACTHRSGALPYGVGVLDGVKIKIYFPDPPKAVGLKMAFPAKNLPLNIHRPRPQVPGGGQFRAQVGPAGAVKLKVGLKRMTTGGGGLL